jgi:hypothetical protein
MPNLNRNIIVWIVAVLPPWVVLAAILFGPTRIDFLESLFGVAPDNGNGSLESALLVVLAAIVTGIASVVFFSKR